MLNIRISKRDLLLQNIFNSFIYFNSVDNLFIYSLHYYQFWNHKRETYLTSRSRNYIKCIPSFLIIMLRGFILFYFLVLRLHFCFVLWFLNNFLIMLLILIYYISYFTYINIYILNGYIFLMIKTFFLKYPFKMFLNFYNKVTQLKESFI